MHKLITVHRNPSPIDKIVVKDGVGDIWATLTPINAGARASISSSVIGTGSIDDTLSTRELRAIAEAFTLAADTAEGTVV